MDEEGICVGEKIPRGRRVLVIDILYYTSVIAKYFARAQRAFHRQI